MGLFFLIVALSSVQLAMLEKDNIRPRNNSRIVTVGDGGGEGEDIVERGAGYRGPGFYSTPPFFGSRPEVSFPVTGPGPYPSYPPPPPSPPPLPPFPAPQESFPYQHYKPAQTVRPYVAAAPPAAALESSSPIAVTPIEHEVLAPSDWSSSGGSWWNPLLKALISALGAQVVLKVPVLLLKLLLKKAVIAPAAFLAATLPTLWPTISTYFNPIPVTPTVISVTNGTFPIVTIANTTFPFITNGTFPFVTVINGTGITVANATGVTGGVTTIIIRGRRRRRPAPADGSTTSAMAAPSFRTIQGSSSSVLIRRRNHRRGDDSIS